jgi:ATP-binding cassette subfamily B protein
VLDEGVQAFSQGAADVGLGLVLVVSAGAIASGAFGVGHLALFTAYLGWLSFLPRMVGRVLARRKQAGVAFDRMRLLVADDHAPHTVRSRDLPVGARDLRVRPCGERPARVPLARLEVIGLTAVYDDVDAAMRTPGVESAPRTGIVDVDFEVGRGEFVVVTGPIGSGKSTLLRALLGLLPTQAGTVRWNGVDLDDRAAFLVPPNAAYLGQVPQLISDSVADNVGLGVVDLVDLERSLRIAAIDRDVDDMPDGSSTLIGPRGLRLSGGQRQRLATARALVHRPELLVLDDLSSAVDVHTEHQLWDNLAATEITVIAVSHRQVAFERADRVLRLSRGRLVS